MTSTNQILDYIYNPQNHKSEPRKMFFYLLYNVNGEVEGFAEFAYLPQNSVLVIDYISTITVDMLDQMNELRVTDSKIEDILNSEKGSRVAGEALYYLSLDWINRKYKYEQDHLHAADRFDGSKPITISMEDWKIWRGNRNRLANLQLLEGRSNGSKNDMPLMDYYNDMNETQAPPIGTEGTVLGVDDIGSVMVKWDNGSRLNVILNKDVIEIMDNQK